MYKYIIIAGICLANSEAPAQTTGSDSLGNSLSSSGGIAYNRMGVCTIKLKDGTRLINCAIKEIKPLYVVFIKNRVMHDITKERVKCIVPENENFVIWFDEKNNAIAGSDCP
ncbi:MAG: hypothetical protein KA163_01205 [Bacteroidia bacterium]|nr:hypothetical protein [Bacteroidia bacterium]